MSLNPKSLVALFACISALTGCMGTERNGVVAEDKEEDDGTSYMQGKADGAFTVVDRGPATYGEAQEINLQSSVDAYRVQSFGGTSLSIDLRGARGVDAYLVVEGPLDGNGDNVAPGEGHFVTFADDSQRADGSFSFDSHLDITLEQPGVYRLITGTFNTLRRQLRVSPSRLTLTTTCNDVCTRPEMTMQALLTELRANGQLEPFLAQARQQIAALIPEPTAAAALTATLDGIAASETFEGLERFPMIPLQEIDAFRLALAGFNAKAPEADRVITGDLSELLSSCANADRANPPAVHPGLPNVGNGHFPDLTLSACQTVQSATLAQIMTSLSVGNGSSVTFHDATIDSPQALLRALMQSGHRVEVRNERSYANFLSLTYGEIAVRWPTWLNTGITLDDGSPFVVPMGHSQETWHISGPEVNARVMFYLGTSGAAFFAQTTVRPAWTGLSAANISANEIGGIDEHALRVAEMSAAYLRRSRIERSTVAQGMPADGYGYVGVCNDSVAAVEAAVEGTITAFPLVRAAELDSAPDLNDGLDEALRSLPNDADIVPNVEDVITRALAMTPHALDSSLIVDETLRAQLVRARSMLGNGSP